MISSCDAEELLVIESSREHGQQFWPDLLWSEQLLRGLEQ